MEGIEHRSRARWRGAVALLAAIAVTGVLAPLPTGAGTGVDDGGTIAASTPRADGGGADPQSPFLCTTELNGLGQPTVDNHAQRGTPVYPEDSDGDPDRSQDPIGWSERCQAPERIEYRYRSTDGSLRPLPEGTTELPDDIATLEVAEMLGTDEMDVGGEAEIPYLLRLQQGTLPQNRFIYSFAMLVPFEEVTGGGAPTTDHWNGRLLFSFGGGVGIGHSQGTLSTGAATMDEAMRLGHAVLYTSGTRTSVHYNLMLGGRTAVEAKDLFVANYGDPRYTVGIGGSGGGIQQYVYAQNHPELLDAAIPQYSYPDMSTQTIHIGDCELLAHYMDELDDTNPRWDDWDNRRLLLGLNSIEGFSSTWQQRLGVSGSTECIEGWRGSTPLAMNPSFGLATGMDSILLPYAAEIVQKLNDGEPPVPDDFPDLGRLLRVSDDPDEWVEWTHWDDVREVYGTDPDTGFGRVPWDNVGVQYGLRYVADGTLSPEEFLDVNARVGSWVEPEDTVPESCGLVEAMIGAQLATFAEMIGMCEGDELDEHSARQMHVSTDAAVPAPRRSGDIDAIRAAFDSGLVFSGELEREIPIIDARHYLEHELDMHNVQQSFGVRERIRLAGGDVDNHLVWFLDARPSIDADATFQLHEDAFRMLDGWVLAHQSDPQGSVADARPAAAVDRCWATDGTLVAEGDDVWSGAVELIRSGAGAWDGTAPTEVDGVTVGPCSAHFPLFSTSRIVAGAPVTGDVYKCHTIPVAEAIEAGIYGEWTPDAQQRAQLEAIHPEGVCDHSRLGIGSPLNDPPEVADLAVTTTESEPVTIELPATDPQGDPLTFEIVDGPTSGTLTGEGPELLYTPDPGFVGTDTFTWRASDGDLTSDPATVTVTVEDPPPDTTTTTTTTTVPPPTVEDDPETTSTMTVDPGVTFGRPDVTTTRTDTVRPTTHRRSRLPVTGAGVLGLVALGFAAIAVGATLRGSGRHLRRRAPDHRPDHPAGR